jgi:hypothetical protein
LKDEVEVEVEVEGRFVVGIGRLDFKGDGLAS